MSKYTFLILGDPIAQGRPRFTRSGHTYNPKRSKDWKNEIKRQMLRKKPKVLLGSLFMVLQFALRRPKSVGRQRQLC